MAGFSSLLFIAIFFCITSLASCENETQVDPSYSGACSGSTKALYGYNGQLTSYNYPYDYCGSYACRWRIHSAGNGTRLNFNYFYLRSSDYVMICDDYYANYCTYIYGGYSTYSVNTSSPWVYIEFRSFSSSCYGGFLLLYNTDPACRADGGTVLTAETGSFSTPYHPYYYPDYETCHWEIRGNVGEHIEVTFSNFSIWYTTNCYNYDYLEIYDGSNFVGRWCGTNGPGAIVSTSNSLRVYFRSTYNPYYWGFTADYTIRRLQSSKPMVPPSIDIDLNATVYTSNGQDITPTCELEYEVEMIYSTQIMVTKVNALLHDGTLCGANTGVHIIWIETEFIASGNRAEIWIDLELPGQGPYKLKDMEVCASAVYYYVRELNNWPQPILPDKPSCPSLYFSPSYFEDNNMMWCRPLDVSGKSALHKYTRHTRPVLPRMPPPGMENAPEFTGMGRNGTKELLEFPEGPRHHVPEKFQVKEGKTMEKN